MKKCFLVGPRTLTDTQKCRIETELEMILKDLINKGYMQFSIGFTNDSDYLVASVMSKLKQKNKNIFLEGIIQNPEMLSSGLKGRMQVFKCCDSFGMFPVTAVIDSSDILLAICDNHTSKEVIYAINYAKVRGKRILQVFI